jgi:hypothetical protein
MGKIRVKLYRAIRASNRWGAGRDLTYVDGAARVPRYGDRIWEVHRRRNVEESNRAKLTSERLPHDGCRRHDRFPVRQHLQAFIGGSCACLGGRGGDGSERRY